MDTEYLEWVAQRLIDVMESEEEESLRLWLDFFTNERDRMRMLIRKTAGTYSFVARRFLGRMVFFRGDDVEIDIIVAKVHSHFSSRLGDAPLVAERASTG